MPLNILIVGAGIGGLATAIALRQQNHTVTVLEKYAQKHEVGFAVSCPPNSARILRAFGLDFRKTRMNSFDGMSFARVDVQPYEILQTMPENAEERYGAPSLAVHRVDLHNALREMAEGVGGVGTPVAVREGVVVVGYDPEDGSVTLEDGSVMSADLVVAADGVKSKAHKWVIGEEHPATLSKLSNVRFCLRTEEMLGNEKLRRTMLNGDYPTIYRGTNLDVGLFRYPCRDNTLQNFGCYMVSNAPINDESKWRTQTNRDILFERLRGFDDNFLEIARCAPENDMYLWKIADRDPLPHFNKGKMIVLGDAAHPMQPTFGMGATFSIEDAAVLGALLPPHTTPPQIPSRLALWNALRWRRASAMQLLCMGERMDYYVLSEETKGKLREIWPEEKEWPELTRPGVNLWAMGFDCVGEARGVVEGMGAAGGQTGGEGVVSGRL